MHWHFQRGELRILVIRAMRSVMSQINEYDDDDDDDDDDDVYITSKSASDSDHCSDV